MGAAGPRDQRDTRAKAYMPSSPNGVKELNSLSFGEFASYRIWRGGHWIGEETPGSRSTVPARPSLPATAGVAVDPRTRARNRKSTGPPDGGPVDYDSLWTSPGSLLQRSGCRPAELPARAQRDDVGGSVGPVCRLREVQQPGRSHGPGDVVGRVIELVVPILETDRPARAPRPYRRRRRCTSRCGAHGRQRGCCLRC